MLSCCVTLWFERLVVYTCNQGSDIGRVLSVIYVNIINVYIAPQLLTPACQLCVWYSIDLHISYFVCESEIHEIFLSFSRSHPAASFMPAMQAIANATSMNSFLKQHCPPLMLHHETLLIILFYVILFICECEQTFLLGWSKKKISVPESGGELELRV